MASEVHRYKIGDIEVTVLSDGFRQVPVNDKYLVNASPEELAKALAAAGQPTDKMKNTYSPIVLTTGGKKVLFDTGNGEAASIESKGERGTLNANLQAAGIERSAIDVVVISHFHADHVNGLLMPDNAPAFPNAEIKVPEVEWKFWMDDGEMSRASKGRMTELFQNNRRVFDTLKRKVTPYAWDKEVVPGVTAVGTPGHSIGHTSFIVTSGGKTVYVQSDVCNNYAVFAPYPDWHGFFDQDPPKAAATRKRVYDMLAAEKLPVQAYHFPFPALARIEKNGSGYKPSFMNSI
ncbi:MBL fold metallo-hydrolase [Rhodoplanes sp. Z2-YC6860]|uniref:MBL fold metallo-hydrolase n=1 Tax=Rhodoplanes sp. Z2-YC6860 TaxID=674703 RepID=UPI00078C57EF|nr:MBL fold metallo-hydrolase [Rhodoplanes sp. Z2-YC6860]AMN41727.1 beta-lactamase-like protein [Rhodoplanes sp. Z2-YC6860]